MVLKPKSGFGIAPPTLVLQGAILLSHAFQQTLGSTNFTAGSELCPCLLPHQLDSIESQIGSDWVRAKFGDNVTLDTFINYGIGCGQHDKELPECSLEGCEAEENMLPKSLNCDKTICNLNFCYVNPNNCELLNRRSVLYPDSTRFFSYATCWDVDSFTSAARISSLQNRVFKVGFNHNSGGWQGAYSSNAVQYVGPSDVWSGPTVDFAITGAERGGYRMNLTVPPEFLRNRSMEYFNSASNFDFCVYATSLGYLDLCLAQYTITDQRASTTDWLVLGSQDVNLIVQYQSTLSGWDRFTEQLRTIFLPFTDDVWLFLVVFVIPMLGMLMVAHEYNHPGSTYCETEDVIVKDNTRPGSVEQVETRRVPIVRHLGRAAYINYLSVLQGNYGHSVVTYGAMLNLLGVSFFILTIISVYTANLAAVSSLLCNQELSSQ